MTAPHQNEDFQQRRQKYVTGLAIRGVVCLVFCGVLTATAYLAEPGSSAFFTAAITILVVLALINWPLWLIGARCQFPLAHFYWHWLIDLISVTAVLHLLGGVELPYGAVGYMIMILTSAVFVSARASMVVASGSLLFFNGMVIAEFSSVLPSNSSIWDHDYSPAVEVFVVLASDVFFFVFAYLAGSLAEELRAANEKLGRARDQVAEYNIQLEARVRDRTRTLEKQNRDIQEFIHVITHDLRNIVIASAEVARRLTLIEEGRLSQKGRRYATHLLEDTRTMAQMLNGLLTLFRVDNTVSQPELVDVGALFAEVARMCRSTIEQVGATVDSGPMPCVIVDKTELRHVLANLLDNALKYRSPDVTPAVHFRHWANESADFFELADNGVGIDAGQYLRIFDLYHRAPVANRADDDKGLGIGLAMVKKIVEKWGGEVSVQSELGQGSKFRFSVPRSSKAKIGGGHWTSGASTTDGSL